MLGRPGSSGRRAAAQARPWQGRAQCWPRARVAEPASWCGIEAGAECSEEGGGVAVVIGRGEGTHDRAVVAAWWQQAARARRVADGHHGWVGAALRHWKQGSETEE